MNAPLPLPMYQLSIVGLVVSAAGAAIAFYLWNERRVEKYLLFWSFAWACGSLRWVLRLMPGHLIQSRIAFRGLDSALISIVELLTILGCYDLLPTKVWRKRTVVAGTAAILVAYTVAANLSRDYILMGYALFAAVLFFCAVCMLRSYRSERLSGFAVTALVFLYQSIFICISLIWIGSQVANSIVAPLFNVPLALSIFMIAHQRGRRDLLASERTLQKIFETAPAAIVITKPPRGEIERANPTALDLLGLSEDSAIGRTSIEEGLVVDGGLREVVYDELRTGQAVRNREISVGRVGGSRRKLVLNAARIDLDGDDRYIFSLYDVTDLRRAEQNLAAYSEEMRRLYLRLGAVEENERRALHRELHDRIGANLSALRLELDLIAKLISRRNLGGASEHTACAVAVITETISKARDLMVDLRPPALDEYGLFAALKALGDAQAARLGIVVDVKGEDLGSRLSPLVETALFRIAQEALNNAVKHSSVKSVRMSLKENGEGIRLVVADEGVGFRLDEIDGRSERWGLRTMRERAQAVGATFKIESETGTGTQITVDVGRASA
jgi:PAS domain S-box-containing protein